MVIYFNLLNNRVHFFPILSKINSYLGLEFYKGKGSPTLCEPDFLAFITSTAKPAIYTGNWFRLLRSGTIRAGEAPVAKVGANINKLRIFSHDNIDLNEHGE